MKKILITILILLSQTLFGSFFENTDIKSKYMFDVGIADKNEELALKLERFQKDEATEVEIQQYLSIRENNETNETKYFQEDVQVDPSLHLNTKPQEKNWFISLYDSFFKQSESNVTAVKGGE